MKVLVTGGAGYIGSHAVVALADTGFEPVTVDNLSEGHREAVLAGVLEVGDLSDQSFLDRVFSTHRPAAVMHFASRCYVGESVENPRRYYEENLGNALALLRAMLEHRVPWLIFSSSCATYGNPVRVPIPEDHPQDPVNPYGETKYFIERMLRWYDRAYGLRSVSLRYFNAAGADPDGRMGEAHDPETHLIPLVLRAALGKGPVKVFGRDYPTRDGTCVRDYIHVTDLAAAHVRALQWLQETERTAAFNLGTGRGHSVAEVIRTAERVTGREVPVVPAPRRPGDPPELVADASRAAAELGWRAELSDLETIIRTAWRWELERRF
ncbi:MAG: UDP-glucose 4-epimerase GalE [Acidobacteriota bacterium]